MRKISTLIFACLVSAFAFAATTYTRVTNFNKIGTNFCDTFLICCEYAGNLYIFDGQNSTQGNYTVIEHFSGNTITGSHQTHECIIEHNQYHSYDNLCSIRCFGAGDRVAKGGYYLAGEAGANGVSFADGQRDVEITWQGEFGIDIMTKSGRGNFQFNTADKVFKFYVAGTQTRPILFVRGDGGDYAKEDESVNELDINYAQADLYARYSDFTKNLYFWDLGLYQSESDSAVPRVNTSIQTATMTALAGDYSLTTANTKAGWVSSSSYLQFPSSEEGGTQAKLTTFELTLTPVSKYDEKWFNYHIVLNCIDSNKKRWKLDKVLPIFCTFTDRDPDNQDEDLETDYEYVMDEKLPTAIQVVSANDLNIMATNGTIYGADHMQIFSVDGRDVTANNGNLHGIFVVKVADKVVKIAVK